MNENGKEVKFKSVLSDPGKSSFRKYRDLYYGEVSLGAALLAEVVQGLFGSTPGAAGLFLRSKCYRFMFASCGRKVVFGRNITLRHAAKIRIGDHVA